MEYTTAMEKLNEDTWHPSVHPIGPGAILDDWGTANPMDEFVRKEMNNDRDEGVFIATPV